MRPDVPVVLMSGYTEQEMLQRFAGSELSGFLQKPFTFADLRDRMRSALT